MKNMIIRNATFDDIAEVAKLHLDGWYETYTGIINKKLCSINCIRNK